MMKLCSLTKSHLMFFIMSKGMAGRFLMVYLPVMAPIFSPLVVRKVASRAPPGNRSDFIYIFAVPINSFSDTSSSKALI